MRHEETSSEQKSDSSQPEPSELFGGERSLALSKNSVLSPSTDLLTTGTHVNISTTQVGFTSGEPRTYSNEITRDSPGSVDDCVNSFELEELKNADEAQLDFPQLPLCTHGMNGLCILNEGDGEECATDSNCVGIPVKPDPLCSQDRIQSLESEERILIPSISDSQSSVCDGIEEKPAERKNLPMQEFSDHLRDKKSETPSKTVPTYGRHSIDAAKNAAVEVEFSFGRGQNSNFDQDNHTEKPSISGFREKRGDTHLRGFPSETLREQNDEHLKSTPRQTRASNSESVVSEIDEIPEDDEHERVAREGKVDIASLPVMKNPLQKAGRHTVIRGRLARDHPFSVGAYNLGYKLVSREHNGRIGATSDPGRRKFFMQDIKAFLKEIGNRHFKVPVIGGGDLDIYLLTREVMLLGGVQNVVRKRAFRIVAQQLGIPKTCTSAASVLKGAYERLLFHYEQRLVFGKWPENPMKAVNMKERVCEEKIKERRTRTCLQLREKRKGYKNRQYHNKGIAISTEKDLFSIPGGNTENLSGSDRLFALATEDDSDYVFELPAWALDIPHEHSCTALIAAAQGIDINNVYTGNEALLLIMAECFDVSERHDETLSVDRPNRDSCLAERILRLSAEAPYVMKAQGFLFNLLSLVANAQEGISLASNNSARGLLDGLVNILQDFCNQYIKGGNERSHCYNETLLSFVVDPDERKRQNFARAYCALRVLTELSRSERNRSYIFLHEEVLRAFVSILFSKETHRVFILSTLEALSNGSSLLSDKNHSQVLRGLLVTLLSVLEKSTGLQSNMNDDNADLSEQMVDFDVSRKVLEFLCNCPGIWGLDSACVSTFMSVISRLLFRQHRVDNLECVAELALNLATAYPELAGEHETLVPGILQLLHSGQCLDFAVETLCVIHTAHPLHSHKDEIRNLCRWQLLSDTQVHSLSHILEAVMGTSQINSAPSAGGLLDRIESKDSDGENLERN